jgi:hypothetical protein
MHMLGRLASATDSRQPQAPHRFVSLQSLTYTGHLWLVLHWQVTVSSDHLCGAEAARRQICVVCKKDPYFTRIGAHGPPSTTVVLMKLRAVCSANTWRSLDASGARWTRPESVRRAAAWPARDARRDDVSRERSAAHQPARGLEGGQTVPPGALRDFFSRWCGGQVCGP